MSDLEIKILLLQARIPAIAARGVHNNAIVKHNERRLRKLLQKVSYVE